MVHGARRTDRQALRYDSLAPDRKQVGEQHLDRAGLLDMRAAAETVVMVLGGRSAPLLLHGGLGTAQLRNEQVRCRPRQQKAGHDAHHDIAADTVHSDEDSLYPPAPANRRQGSLKPHAALALGLPQDEASAVWREELNAN